MWRLGKPSDSWRNRAGAQPGAGPYLETKSHFVNGNAGAICAIAGFGPLARFIREGAESGLWGDEITPNMMAPGCFWLCDGAG